MAVHTAESETVRRRWRRNLSHKLSFGFTSARLGLDHAQPALRCPRMGEGAGTLNLQLNLFAGSPGMAESTGGSP